MRFLHAADLHIDSPLQGLSRYEGAPVDELQGATRRALGALVREAVSRRVDLVVIAGDLYDGSWRDYSTGLFTVRCLAELAEAGIDVVLLYGNHDAESVLTRQLRLPDRVRALSADAPEVVDLPDLGVAVVGQSYAHKKVLDDLAAGYPRADGDRFTIGLLHTALEGAEGHYPYAPCTLDGLRSRGYGYWALGHVHRRSVVCDDPWVVYPGNLQGRHARELGPKGATLVEVHAGEVDHVEHLVLDVVRWAGVDVDVAEASDLDDALDAVGDALAAASDEADGRLLAARVRLVGASPAHQSLWQAPERTVAEVRSVAAQRRDVWIEKVVIETASPRSLDDLRADPLVARLLDRFDELGDAGAAAGPVGTALEALRKVPVGILEEAVGEDPVALVAEAEQLLLQALAAGEV